MTLGPLGRLGHWTATHFRAVALAWLVVAVGLGVFAPRVEHALSGAGWEATGSESVQARELVDRSFQGQGSYGLMAVVHSGGSTCPKARGNVGIASPAPMCLIVAPIRI